MHLAALGLTPVKGGRHHGVASAELGTHGVVGDRAFCLVDPRTDRCLRTVDHPSLLRTVPSWDGETLTIELPAGAATGVPVRTGETRTVDYWGRAVEAEVVAGPWAAAYADLLGREVLLVATGPGDVVYGGAVTLVTRASVAAAAEDAGATVDPARFRATCLLDGDLAPWEEEAWVGRRLRLGPAELRIRRPVVRCAVVDHDPVSGVRDLRLLRSLGRRGEPVFGVDADVLVPGRVVPGDPAELVSG